MKYDKIRTVDNLEDIMSRVKGCASLVSLLCEIAESSCIPSDALRSVSDLLESICRDFQTEIDNAGKEAQA